jgi:hypothetical protein
MTRSLTSLDVVLILTIPGVYPQGVYLQGFAADDIFDLSSYKPNVTKMGVDGIVSAAHQYQPRVMKIHIEGSSDSQQVFDDWAAAENTPPVDAIPASMTAIFQANGQEYTCTRGFLTDYKDAPDAKKTLGSLTYEITWQLVQKTAV